MVTVGTPLQQLVFFVLFGLPVTAMFLAFKGSPGIRRASRYVVALTWLAYGAATAWCLWVVFFKPSTGVGVGNGIFLIIALPVGLFAGINFTVWRAALRHEYVQSLPPDLRRQEELIDIENGLESARATLASAQSKLGGWGLSAEKRRQLEAQAAAARFTIRSLEEARAKRR
jgi:hypothetical protein